MKNYFPKLTDKEFIENIDLITDLDIFTRRYLKTGNIVDEYVDIIENGTYDDADYSNKRLRFAEQVIYCWILKDIYALINQIKTKSIKFSMDLVGDNVYDDSITYSFVAEVANC